MPAYKVEKYISAAIESVLAQTFRDWELIIVNDGSPDDSKSVAESYAIKDDRISVVSKPNGGLSSARNFGLRYAIGEYVHFFDSDDRILHNHYENYLKSLETTPDIVIAGYYVEYLDENETVKKLETRSLPTTSGKEIDAKEPQEVIKFVCYAWNKLFRREFIEKNKLFYEEGLSRIEDAEFMSRAVTCNPTVVYTTTGTYVYEQRPEITLSKGFDPSIIGILKRRKSIDKKLITYFNAGLSAAEVFEIEKRLNASAIRSAVNRLFDASKDSTVLHSNLKRIKSELLTKDHSFCDRSLMQRCFDKCTYYALKHNKFLLLKTLQCFRH